MEQAAESLRRAARRLGFAEALAFGSLVLEGTPVRLSGQDCARGTFSQRHATYYDFEDGHKYMPLKHVEPGQARFDVWKLVERVRGNGVRVRLQRGRSFTLVIWEAQFGDFANGAQIMIDQFIASAERKWGQPSGLTLLLPHGYEGQGPEHSSARIERFLQLAAGGNIQVVNPTTPAQYFHLLRRQARRVARDIRKPLVVFTPKSLLRHASAVSTVDELTTAGFQEVIPEREAIDEQRVSRILLCAGKIYFDLAAARAGRRKLENAAIIRIEQLYPFPYAQLQRELRRYPLSAEILWVQEEPRNMEHGDSRTSRFSRSLHRTAAY